MQKNKYVIVSPLTGDECVNSLKSLGYDVFKAGLLSSVDKAVCHHTDMQIVKAREDLYVCAPELYDHFSPLFEKTDLKLISGNENPFGKYPGDVCYNVAVTDKYAIHNFAYTDKVYTDNSDYIKVNVKQGYSKCNICIVGKEAVITSDRGVALALEKYNIDVLAIRPGYIALPGYDYGFIGGCSGLLKKNLLVFNGNISLHPDSDSILSFCKNHGTDVYSLSKGVLTDIGTITPLG